MPQFNNDAVERIRNIVRYGEANFSDNTTPDDHSGVFYSEVPITFVNGSGEIVPRYGVLAITDGEEYAGTPRIVGNKPSTTYRALYAVNGYYPVEADAGGMGQCYTYGSVLVAYDTGTPAVGESWEPKSGQWTLTKGSGSGWHVVVHGIFDADAKILIGRIVVPTEPPPRVSFFGYSVVTSSGSTAYINGVGSLLNGSQGTVYCQYTQPSLYGEEKTAYFSHAGVLQIVPTGSYAYGDPFAEVLKSGLWRVDVFLEAEVASSSAAYYSTHDVTTGPADPAYHTHTVAELMPLNANCNCKAFVWYKGPDESSYSHSAAGTEVYTNVFTKGARGHMSSDVFLEEGTLLQIGTEVYSYNYATDPGVKILALIVKLQYLGRYGYEPPA